ncbi:endonuclease/exonuclease/phosphatase family protein [Streptomyces sp. RS10V-4]|uniref:endonuclease/exonuclease/phosphatase family protein n=1 Tax=Streptomyces rhizoryzae TaxID=2932493 RepID=UPI0020031FB5|nr:endonuclease/exonuclease/phosphatase family protein [Streptomyces rhizoryzae]MCK7622511.1 endonuclease/exonuclease/phosphatase family protein [Streptomyces rhizoryzae]
MINANDQVRVVTWNLEHNGHERDGATDRWHLAMGILADLQPHILLRQELTRANMYGMRAVYAEAVRLGVHMPFLASATPESANPTGVYVDMALFEPVQFFEHVTGMWHPICNPVVRLKGASKALSLASVHLCSFDPDLRVTEAKRLTTLGKPGMETLLGGDFNSYVHFEDEASSLPDWATVQDRTHFEHRTVDRGGKRVSDTRPDRILAGTHHGRPPIFTELGQHAASLGVAGALNPTSSLWRTDQGGMQRIDRIYATPQIAAALIDLRVIDIPEVQVVSDHCPVMATFSLNRLREALSDTAPAAAAA